MDQYVGLDVSQDETHICVVDRDGNKLWEGSCDSTPEGITQLSAPQIVASITMANISSNPWRLLRSATRGSSRLEKCDKKSGDSAMK